MPEPPLELDTPYHKNVFPDDEPFPYAAALGYPRMKEFKWAKITAQPPNWYSPDDEVRRRARLRYFLRQANACVCCCGLGDAAALYLWGIAGTTAAFVLAQVWVGFVNKHAEGLFNDGATELPLAWNDLGFCVAVTAVIGFLGGFVMMSVKLYQWSRHRKRRLNRTAWNRLDRRAREDDAHCPDYSYDYDSDVEPLAAYKWFHQDELFAAACQLAPYSKRQREVVPVLVEAAQAERKEVECEGRRENMKRQAQRVTTGTGLLQRKGFTKAL